MNAFLQRHAGSVLGVLSGFDRLVWRGHLRALSYPHGLECFLSANRILLKDFKDFAQRSTDRLVADSLARAHGLGREVRYLNSCNLRKEDVARSIAARDGIKDGLICVLSCVEPCLSFELRKDRQRKRLQIQFRQRKCLHLYHYYQHPVFGFMHARIQTWLPFAVQVCLNGREWLARQMDQAGIGYVRRDNCFTALDDVAGAQALFDRQLRADWPALLNGLLRQIHPAHPEILGRLPHHYYWSVHRRFP